MIPEDRATWNLLGLGDPEAAIKELADAYNAGRADGLAELGARVKALDTTKEGTCSCDIGDGDWTGEGRCVGCGHPPHAHDACPAPDHYGMLVSEYRRSVLDLLGPGEQP